MFERKVDYEAAYIGKFPSFEEDAGPALRWAAQKAQVHSSGMTVVAPTRRHFRDTPLLASLPTGVQTETPQTLGHFPRVHPVVVSLWLTGKDLERIDGASGLKALAVVPWLEDEIATWRQARGAIDLLGRQPAPSPPTIGDPVVEVALRSLTQMVNLSTALGHPRDRSMAIHAFKILKRNGHVYDPAEVRAWAMANGWAADDARELGEYAAGVLNNRAYRAGPSGWKPQIIRMWRKDAAEDTRQ